MDSKIFIMTVEQHATKDVESVIYCLKSMTNPRIWGLAVDLCNGPYDSINIVNIEVRVEYCKFKAKET